jgi:YacP-like NYN domain-containing protein
VAQDAPAGPSSLRHDHLRSALQYVVTTAASWQKQRPPRSVPPALKPFLRQQRLAAAALGRVRRIVEADGEFRSEVAEAVTPGAVDEIGIEWLRREPGWDERIEALIERAESEAADRDLERELGRERKRRQAAEVAASRTNADVAALRQRVADREAELAALRSDQASEAVERDELRRALAELKLQARHADDRAAAARQRLDHVEGERDAARRRAEDAEQRRDELLAARAELAGGASGTAQVASLRDLADAARSLADRLGVLVAPGRRRRRPVEVPRPAAKDPRLTAEFLLRVPGIAVIVDGYNVAKLAWPDLSLEQQRTRMLDAVDGLARRFGTELVVVIDGADVVGAHTDRRRLARVTYSPARVTADEVIREEVAALDPARPVAVVTNDGEIRRDIAAAGGNVITSDALVAVALR